VIFAHKAPAAIMLAIMVMNSAATEPNADMAICSNIAVTKICAQFRMEDVFLQENAPIVEYGSVSQK